MQELHLSAQPGAWRIFASRRQDPAFKKFMTRVFERDNYTCQYCGFQAKEYQEVINLDQDYYNNKLSNLMTSCVFCSQCFFLDAVGVGDYGGGSLIYLPEISQANLNSFCHVLFCAITNGTGYKSSAQAIYRTLKFRSQAVERELGEGMSTPSVLGRSLVEMNFPDDKVDQLVENLRLLPSRGRFRTQIEHWAATALQELASTPPVE